MDDPQRELWEHADGRPASPRLRRALDESPLLRVELEQARRQVAGLRASLAGFKLDEARASAMREQITAELPGRVYSMWKVGIAAAVAASLVLAIGGYFIFGPDGSKARGNESVAANTDKPGAPKHRLWQVERFSPQSSNVQGEVIRSEQRLNSGETLTVGQQEYARVSEAATGATWLAYPGTRVAANGTLKLERGAMELQGSRNADVEVMAAGRTYSSRSNFMIAVDGAATLVSVYSGSVSETDDSGKKNLNPGRHETGSSKEFAALDASAAYVKGFEAWTASDWKAARFQFKIASESPDLDEQSRCNAHFYWFAAAGNEGDRAAAVEIGESYLKSYPQDSSLDYVRYFLGEYLLELGQRDRGMAYLKVVAAGPVGNLRDLARSILDQQNGGAADKAQALWQAFYASWQQKDYAAGEAKLRALIRAYPGDAGVKSGDATFHLFACLGNQGKLEAAVALADQLFKEHPNYPAGDYVLYFKAAYLSQLGKRIEALDALGRLDSNYPNTSMRLFVDALRKELQAQK